MIDIVTIIILPFLIAFVGVVVATPLSLVFIRKWGLFDDPKKHRHPAMLHKKPVPRGGGIPLFVGMWVAGIFFLPKTEITIALFLASLLALVVGVLDDKYDISPYVRFGINILTAVLVVAAGVHIPFITNPFGGIIPLSSLTIPLSLIGIQGSLFFSDIITIVWIVWVMNMLNWSKGVDGQMPGIVAISAIIIGILSLRFPVIDAHTLTAATLSFMIAGSAIGFLFFNFYPAKIFPGYGATALYLLLAVVSILSSVKLATAILVMGVPMIDGVFTIGRRVMTGHSPFRHDKKHLHHLLLQFGFDQRRIALFYWGVSAIVGVLSLFLSSKGKVFAISMLVVLVGAVLLFLHLALRTNEENDL